MKLGIGLPNTMAHDTDRALMLDWARLAEDAGFDLLATIDKPNYDAWDPLVTLAGVAGVTERIGLATTILQLPPRNEVLVAKQAAVVDQLSAGRLVLGVAQGGREDDYEVFGAPFHGRSERFEAQVGRIRAIWADARSSDRDHGVLGPPPVQDPGPPIWAGAGTPRSIARAARIADGFVFGTAGSTAMKERAPRIRNAFAGERKPEITLAGLAYVAVGDDPRAALDEGAHHVLRYYGQLWTEPRNLIHHGPPAKIAEEVAAYEGAVDVLILFPQIPRLDQVEQLAEGVLPAYQPEAVAAR
jgi:alkanesulfonate monooxygenase SsuD/methylene tetrahydromethanopterin reductase-like flavin-dependent oxidoreductase (luciferase family)